MKIRASQKNRKAHSPSRYGWPRPTRRGHAAFTLLEVLLAVAIAVGMLAVVLFFYKQAANLRVQLFYETARISAARLLLDRLTSELNNARHSPAFQVGMKGGTESIEFARLDVPHAQGWTNTSEATLVAPLSPFRLIRYAAVRSLDGTNVIGLTRSEEPMLKRSLAPPDESELAETNDVAARRPFASIDQFRFVRFRYWDGATWLDAWTAADLPAGVEVSLGAEPLPEEIEPDDYPYELFRRIIFLPGYLSDRRENLPRDSSAGFSP